MQGDPVGSKAPNTSQEDRLTMAEQPVEAGRSTPDITAWVKGLNTAAERLWPLLQASYQENKATAVAHSGGVDGFTVEVVPSIDSTNSELMRRARNGQAEPALLMAANQTAGRGRMGKTWQSKTGDSLTFSMSLPYSPGSWAGLSLAVGVSLADSLQTLLESQETMLAIPPVQLKWPNDVWLDGQKLAGILVETAHAGTSRCMVVGVGINLHPPAAQVAESASTSSHTSDGHWAGVPPAGLLQYAPHLVGTDVLMAVIPPLLRDVLAFEALGFPAFEHRFSHRDALKDRFLTLSDGTTGIGVGVDPEGALLVLTPQGIKTLNSSEVSVRPQEPHPC